MLVMPSLFGMPVSREGLRPPVNSTVVSRACETDWASAAKAGSSRVAASEPATAAGFCAANWAWIWLSSAALSCSCASAWSSPAGKPALASSNFDYAGRLTETMLLGNIAVRFAGKKLEWDAAKLQFTNSAAAQKFVSKEYRKGWDFLTKG